MKKFFLLFYILLCFKTFGNECLETRAAINMGASNTHLVVAIIDICKIEIAKFLLEKNIVIDFTTPFKKNMHLISRPLQIKAIDQIQNLLTLANQYRPKKIILIPSKFFKIGQNYMDFFKKIKNQLKVNIFLPNLKTEAILGYLGVKIKFPKTSKLLVWDVGAHGMNWTLMDEKFNFKVYFEKINPNIFKNMVIEGVLKKNHKEVTSPNPLGKQNALDALELIKLYVTFNTPPNLKQKAQGFKVVGIGGFHNQSIMKQIGQKGETYNLEQLEMALKRKNGLKDKEIGGPFAQHQVTNLILAMGFLTSLSINQIFTTSLNEAHGALMYPNFWK